MRGFTMNGSNNAIKREAEGECFFKFFTKGYFHHFSKIVGCTNNSVGKKNPIRK